MQAKMKEEKRRRRISKRQGDLGRRRTDGLLNSLVINNHDFLDLAIATKLRFQVSLASPD
jgi:hypothetical protein